LKVTILQTDIHWARPDENISEAARLIDTHPAADLYLLPEMWSTGFAPNPVGIAQPETGNAALQWMHREAVRRKCAIGGSLAVQLADGSYRNRHYFVDGHTDRIYYYDKHHLFTYGHENEHYTPGQERIIVSYGGMRLLLLTCYDLRFPVWCRYSSTLAYDAIVVVANWPAARQGNWQVLTRVRALENQCYLIGVNRVGDDCFGHYAGGSCVIDAYGGTVAQCRKNEVEALTVSLDLHELQRRRQKFRVLEDRDEYAIL
jgi:predicted amidohydrolase